MAVEQFSNAPQTTITEDLTDVETDVDVASFAGFPTAAQYRILIESELMLVTAGAGTGTWTVTRGAEGTANVAHSSGATVTHVLTAGAIQQKRADDVATGAYSAIPAAAIAGRLYLPSDSYHISRDTGAAWAHWGPLFPMTPPPAAGSWTWVSQGGATVTQSGSGLWMYCAAENVDIYRMLVVATPAPPYSVVMFLQNLSHALQYPQFFHGWRESASGNCAGLNQYSDSYTIVTNSQKTDSTPKAFANYVSVTARSFFGWIKFEDDGANRSISLSIDGLNWVLFHSVGRTDYITPDQIGWGFGPRNANWSAGLLLASWKVS
jgi:hypothetical protein